MNELQAENARLREELAKAQEEARQNLLWLIAAGLYAAGCELVIPEWAILEAGEGVTVTRTSHPGRVEVFRFEKSERSRG